MLLEVMNYDDTLLELTKGYVGANYYGMYLMGINPLGKWKKRRLISKAEIEIQQYKAKSQLELTKNRQLRDAENKVSLSMLDLEQSGSIQNK
jgi:hypothetical protein